MQLFAEVLNILSYENMAQLLSVNRALHSQVHQHVTSIALWTYARSYKHRETNEESRQSDVNLLLEGGWPSLQSLNFQGGQMHARLMLQLSHGKWQMLRRLDLEYTNMDTASLRALVKADWPIMQHLQITSIIFH